MTSRSDLDDALLPSEPESSFHLADYLQVLRRHWKLLLASSLVCVLGGAIHFAITPKQYRASTTLQIERRSSTSLTGQQNPWLENYWNLEYYPTQFRLIQSRGMAERVVRRLRLHESGTAAPATNPADQAPTAAQDEAVLAAIAGGILGGLEVNPVANTQLVEIAYRSADPQKAMKLANGFAEEYIDWGIETRSVSATRASGFLGTQIEELKQEIQDKEAQLQTFGRRSDIVATGDNRGTSVLSQRLEALNADYSRAVSERISLETRYRQLEATSSEAIADTLSGGLVAELRGEQIRLEREYATKLNTYKPEWPAMVELKSKIDRGNENLKSVVAETVGKAREKALSDFRTAQRQEQALATELERTRDLASSLNSSAVTYENLQMEISTRRALLDQLLTRQSETAVAGRLQDQRESNVRVVDRALLPGAAFRPSLQQDLTMGLMLGLMLGIGGVVLIEYLDRTIKTSEELERIVGLPVLAVIPDVTAGGRAYGYNSSAYGYGYGAKRRGRGERRRPDSGERQVVSASPAPRDPEAVEPPIELLPHSRPRLVASEAYRALRTSLLLSSADELKAVAITSTQSGEGKTATATNLAVVMAQLGRRVLLIDADLRKPRVHEVFNLSNRSGVVNVLTGTATPEETYLATDVPGLSVMPSGPLPPNPSELLASDRMRDLVRYLRARFDFVIVDTPPTLAVTDPTLVGAIVDGVVLCVRARKVLRDDARLCRERLRLSEIKVLGTVLNRYRATTSGYGKRYDHYVAYAYSDEDSGEHTRRGSAA